MKVPIPAKRAIDGNATLRVKEAGTASEVVAVSIEVKQAQETLRTALAMGADPFTPCPG